MSSANVSRSRPGLMRILLIAGVVVVALFIILQLAPVQRTNPAVVREPHWDSPQTRELAQRACYDCHSNETVWPWYAYIAPVSWSVAREVNEGREVLNFSDWDHLSGEVREGGEISEVLDEGRMPPSQYVGMHPSANLTPEEKRALAQGLQATIRQDPPSRASSEGAEHD